MKKRTIKPITDYIHERLSVLLKDDNPSIAPAICLGCGDSWILYLTEDAQFTRVHRCPAHRRGTPRHRVLRLAIERIGATRDERDELAYKRRQMLAGRVVK